MIKTIHHRSTLATALFTVLLVSICTLPGCVAFDRVFRPELHQTRQLISRVDSQLAVIPASDAAPANSSHAQAVNELKKRIQHHNDDPQVADQLRIRLVRLYMQHGDLKDAESSFNGIDPTRNLPNARDQAIYDLFPTELWWRKTQGAVPPVGFDSRAGDEIKRIDDVVRPLFSEKENAEIARYYSELAAQIGIALIRHSLPSADRIEDDESWASAKPNVVMALELFGEAYTPHIRDTNSSNPVFIRAEKLVDEIRDALKDPSTSQTVDIQTGRAYKALEHSVRQRATQG